MRAGWRIDGQTTDMTRLIVAFRKVANAPKNQLISQSCVCVCVYIYIYIHTHTHNVPSYMFWRSTAIIT